MNVLLLELPMYFVVVIEVESYSHLCICRAVWNRNSHSLIHYHDDYCSFQLGPITGSKIQKIPRCMPATGKHAPGFLEIIFMQICKCVCPPPRL